MTWVQWNGGKAHSARVNERDVRVGSFPLECGRWAPDGFDADVTVAYSWAPRCARCAAAVARQNEVDDLAMGRSAT